jgi:hypothetical protein
MEAMESNRTGVSLLVTMGVMLGLGVVGAVHRAGRTTAARGSADGEGNLPHAQAEALGVAHPFHEVPTAEWDVLTGCELVENKTDAAHHFHVRRGDDTYVFELYYTSAPETSHAEVEHVNEQARYFGFSESVAEDEWEEELGRLGDEAWSGAADLLGRESFMVFTKWEKRPGTHHYYALVRLERKSGKFGLLQEWLAESGLAIMREPTLKRLPDGRSSTAFLEYLQNLQHQAQQRRLGAWRRPVNRSGETVPTVGER